LVSRGAIKDEEDYLIELSKRESGFSKGLPLINLTQFSNEELYRIKLETERRIEENYRKYLFTHPAEIFFYFRDRLIYKKYLFKPILMIRRLCEKLGLLRGREDETKTEKRLKLKHLEYQL
jgi:hypothetical protein